MQNMYRRSPKFSSEAIPPGMASDRPVSSDPVLCEKVPQPLKNQSNPAKLPSVPDHQKLVRTQSLASSDLFIPHGKRDLFRAFLDIRPHNVDKESNEHYNRIDRVTRSGKACEAGEIGRISSASEFFMGGQSGKNEKMGMLKLKIDSARNVVAAGSVESLKTDSVGRCLTPGPSGETKVFCNGKAKSCIKMSCDETKSDWNGPYFSATEAPYKPTKKYFYHNINTYDNIFGDRFETNTTMNNNEIASNASSESDFRATAFDSATISDSQESKDKLYRVITGPTRCSAWLLENECSRRVLGLDPDEMNHKMETMFRPQKKQFIKPSSTSMNLSLSDYDPLESPDPSNETLKAEKSESLIPEGLIPEGFPDGVEVPRLKKFNSTKTPRTKSEVPSSTDTNGDQNKSDSRLNILLTRDSDRASPQACQKLSIGGPKRSECTWFRDTSACSGDKVVEWPDCKFNFKIPS